MAVLQKKIKKLGLRGGINWNKPVEMIPEGQIAFGQNIRQQKDGEVTGRPGLTSFATLGVTYNYIHSMSRLNDFSPELGFSGLETYVVGADTSVWIGANNTALGNTSLSRILFLNRNANPPTLDGNPINMVDSYCSDGHSGLKYISNNSGNWGVGYYTGDTPGVSHPRGILMGMIPPTWFPSITPGGGGNLTGSYQWAVRYRRINTGATSNPSAATRNTQSTPAIALSSQSATFTLPNTPIDPLTATNDTNVVIDVYRFGGSVLRWALVGTGTTGASFTDNTPDLQLLAAPSPPTTVDPNTGLTRFSNFCPFVAPTQSIVSTSNATVTKAGGTGIWTIAASGADTFPIGLLPGSSIIINTLAFTVYQVRSPTGTDEGPATVIELTEDATGGLTSGSTYPWKIPGGSLVQGTPCTHLWGPYGLGQTGAVIFGCGPLEAPGTLFWTNGNDPDSMDLANSLVVTNPSEPLRGGVVFNGTGYVWSSDRQFQIFPSLTVQGQFYVQEVIGGRGLLMEWSLSVQASSVGDRSITWVSKDGVYDWTPGGGTQSLTEAQLYPFFPHDNTQGQSLSSLFPWWSGLTSPPTVTNPDFEQGQNPIPSYSKFHRLTWFDGYLFYDYPFQSGAGYGTLVLDSKVTQGWISYDVYFNVNSYTISRMSEVASNNMKVAFANGSSISTMYDYSTLVGSNTDDAGTAIKSRLITGADDTGDTRSQKLFMDAWLDMNANGNSVAVNNLYALHMSVATPSGSPYSTSGRAGKILDLKDVSGNLNGLGLLDVSLGLDISWSGTGTILYQWQFSYAPKPEVQALRSLDKTDDGWIGSKYLRGFVLECNTYNQARKVNVLVDGVKATNPLTSTTVFTINSGTNTQAELPFGVSTIIGQELQLAIDSSDSSTAGWEVFSIRWVWEKWADLDEKSSPIYNLGSSRAKYIRGFILPLDTGGATATFLAGVNLQGSISFVNPIISTPAVAAAATGSKSDIVFSFDPPVLAHQIQITPSIAVRAWWDEIVWDYEEWPEYSQEYSLWMMPAGHAKSAYIRGFSMPIDTEGNVVSFVARLDNGTTVNMGSFSTTPGIKTVQPFVFAAPSVSPPVVSHVVRIEPQQPCRCWFQEIVWDAEEYPELDLEYSPIVNCGTVRAKFMQGLVIPLDTNGQPVVFEIVNIDTGFVGYTTPAVTSSGKQVQAFSWTPFIAHLIQIIPLSPARIFIQEASWQFEPTPELALTWTTPPMTHGMSGWLHERLAWVAYLAPSGPVTFTRTFSDGTSENYIMPITGGLYAKTFVPLSPKKSVWFQYSATGGSVFKIFQNDFELHCKQWGSEGPYNVVKPIGAPSVVQGAGI